MGDEVLHRRPSPHDADRAPGGADSLILAGLDPELLALLCCPVCRADLECAHEDSREEGPPSPVLRCGRCRERYPVVDGIPVLLPPEREGSPDDDSRYWNSPENAARYAEFSEGKHSLLGKHRHRMELESTLELAGSLEGRRVLDAGCGSGRFFEALPPSTEAFGLDASLELLRLVKAQGRCSRLVCGELERLPFREGSFERVLSVRVLHHIREPERAIDELVRVLEPSGELLLHVNGALGSQALLKRVRQSPRWQPRLDAFARSLHPEIATFAPWPLEQDTRHRVSQLKGWLRAAGADARNVRGSGFGFHQWLLDEGLIGLRLERDRPALLERLLSMSGRAERLLGRIPLLRGTLDRILVRGVKREAG